MFDNLSIEDHASPMRVSTSFSVDEMKWENNSNVKLATVVEGDQKAPFSLATTPRCWGGRYSFPWIAPLYPWYVPYNAEC